MTTVEEHPCKDGHTRIHWIGDLYYPRCPLCGEEVPQ